MKKSKAIGVSLLWVLLFFGVQVILSLAVTIGGSLSNLSGDIMENALQAVPKVLVLSNIITVILVLMTVKLNGETWSGNLGLRWASVADLLVSTVFAAALAPLTSYLLEIIPIPDSLTEFYNEVIGKVVGDGSIYSVAATVVLAPVCEELVFRGAIFNTLRRAFPVFPSVLICAFLFGLVHMNPIQSAYAFVLGMLLCLVCVRFDSLWASIAMHIIFNLVGGYADITVLPEQYRNIVLIAAGAVALIIFVWLLATGKKGHKKRR